MIYPFDGYPSIWENISKRIHPPVASAVVEKPEYDPDHVYAWKPANNYKGWKLIARGKAGEEDASVIQEAIDNINKGRVYLRAGEYKINTSIRLKENIILVGEGAGVAIEDTNWITKLTFVGDSGGLIDATGLRYFGIERVHLDGGGVAEYGIKSGSTVIPKTIHLEDIVLKNTGNVGVGLDFVVQGYGAEDSHFESIVVNGWNIGIRYPHTGNTFVKINVVSNNIGYLAANYSENTFIGCVFSGNGVDIQFSDNYINTHSFYSCWFENSTTAIINRPSVTYYPMGSVVFVGCMLHTNSTSHLLDLKNIRTSLIILGGRIGSKTQSGLIECNSTKPSYIKIVGVENQELLTFAGAYDLDIGNYYYKKWKSSGTAAFSGDGSTTQFKIAHGLVSTPSKVLVTPMSADAAGDFYVTADDTYIYINYKTAPPSGTDNIKVSFYAEV